MMASEKKSKYLLSSIYRKAILCIITSFESFCFVLVCTLVPCLQAHGHLNWVGLGGGGDTDVEVELRAGSVYMLHLFFNG